MTTPAGVSHAHGKTYVDVNRPAAKKAQKAFKKTLALALTKLGRKVSKQLATTLKGLGKADTSHGQPDIEQILLSLDITFDEDLSTELRDELADVYASAGEAGLAQLGVQMKSQLVNQVNDRAANWARDHAADLVGTNEDSEYWISDATREMLRGTITSGIEDGIPAEELSAQIEDNYAFSEDRAALIAETEIATANGQGALAGYEEAAADGINVGKSWLILDDACDDCQENEDAGTIALDEDFPSGDPAPPAHPNCRCVIVPEVEDASGEVTDGEESDDGGDLELMAKWDEDAHPRDEHGRFGSGGGNTSETRAMGWAGHDLKAEEVHPAIAAVATPEQIEHLRDVISNKGDQEAVLNAMSPIYDAIKSGPPDTLVMEKYKDENGNTKERVPAGFFEGRTYNVDGEKVPLEPAIDHLVAGAEAFSSPKDEPSAMRYDKEAFIILGPSAAGKSGIAEYLAIQHGAAIVDSDEAKKIIDEYKGGIGANAVHEESSQMSRFIEQGITDKGGNLIVPTVGANPSGPTGRIDRLKELGYKVTLVDAYVTKDEATRRMASRAISTGRPIGAGYVRGVGDLPTQTYDSIKGKADSYMRIDANGPKDHERITEVHNRGDYRAGTPLKGRRG